VQLQVDEALGLPRFSALVSLLLSRWGLITAAPVLALGVVGAVLLCRRGKRADALVIAAVSAAYLLYAAGFFDPFGSVPPGPRYLTPMVPFLAALSAIAFRVLPLLTAVLAAGSLCIAGAVTATRPHIAWDGDVLYRLVHPSWWSPTAADLVGIHGWYRLLPLAAAFLVAIVCTALVTPLRPGSRREAFATALAVAGWIVVATQGTRLIDAQALDQDLGALLLLFGVLLLGAAVIALLRSARDRRRRLPA
jgi:hypothetical protein